VAEPIPFVDLQWQHSEVEKQIHAGWDEVLANTAFILGPAVSAFEEEFARFCNVSHCVGVGNGTDAVELALRACGIGEGHRVVVPTNTFVATAEAVVRAGAVPVFVDCDPTTYLIDTDQAIGAMSSADAVIPVHLYGQLAPMERLIAPNSLRGAVVLEDAAQAQGALRSGRGIGAWGAAAATSFYPGKNLGAYGDAGAVLTNDGECAARIRRLSNHGAPSEAGARSFGLNSRLDALQAVVLRAKLAELKRWNALRCEAAARYRDLFADDERIVLPVEAANNMHVWHLFVVQVPDRDNVRRELIRSGIGVGIHYQTPIHLEEPFARFGSGPGSLPVAEAAAKRILSLPIFPGITEEQQERVARSLKSVLTDLKARC
jgi:dTDP-4-amino-4,6-dideoxygalactose transaminase